MLIVSSNSNDFKIGTGLIRKQVIKRRASISSVANRSEALIITEIQTSFGTSNEFINSSSAYAHWPLKLLLSRNLKPISMTFTLAFETA